MTLENSKQRLVEILSYLASGAEEGSGMVEIYLAKAQALLNLNDNHAARDAYNEAYNQCRNQAERNRFKKLMQSG